MDMKNYRLKFAIVLFILALVFALTLWAVFSCSIVNVANALSEQNALLAPISNLKDNEYALVSTLKVNVKSPTMEEVYLPESYYAINPVPVGDEGGFYEVEYCGISFFYLSNELNLETVTFPDGVDGNPDVRLTLKDDVASVDIKGTTVSNLHTIKLIGYNQDGSEVYVIATLDGVSVKGFVDIDNFSPFNVPYHPIAQAQRDALLAQINQQLPSEGDITPNTSVALRIVLIIGIAVPAILIAILLFKPTKHSRRQVRDEQKEYDYDEPRDNRRRN